MSFDQLKKLAKKLGGILVLNGNEPEFVILPYEQFQKTDGTINSNNSNESPGEQEDEKTIEKLNQEILALKEEIHQKESAELIEDAEGKEAVADIIDFE